MADQTYPSFPQVLALINEKTTVALTVGEITTTGPTPLSDDPSGMNTSLPISAATMSGYEGSVTFKYDRLNLGNLLTVTAQDPDPGLFAWRSMAFGTLVYGLNLVRGFNLDVTDLEGLPSLTNAAQEEAITLTAATDSFLVIGSGQVNLNIFPIEELETAAASAVSSLSVLNTLNPS
jgi:hypothetical protein